MVAAIFHRSWHQLVRLGVPPIGDERQLIGLQDSRGTRYFIVAQDTPGADRWLTEAVYVLCECPPSPPAAA